MRDAAATAACPLSRLCLDLMTYVLSFLPIKDHVVSLPDVCRHFRSLLKRPPAWPTALSFAGLPGFRGISSTGALNVVGHLGKFARLCFKFKHVDLAHCNVTDASLTHLAAMPLQTLSLECCYEITDAGLAHLAALPLQTLILEDCEMITDTGLAHLAALPLQTLNLSCCENITDVGLAHLAALSLQTLNLSFCQNITDVGLAHLAALPLQSLILSYCENITDAGLTHLVCMPLQTLDLVGCKKLTGTGRSFMRRLPESIYCRSRLVKINNC
jgi:hypothetical protein